MKIEKIIKKKNNLYQILLSDNTSLSFYDETIIKYNLLVKKEFDSKLLAEIVTYNNNIKAYYEALKYIQSKLRTKKEVIDKLKKKNYSNDIINKTIKRLEEQKYLNDSIYIKSYINDQINLSLNGPKKIIHELEKLGFKNENISAYLTQYDSIVWQEKIKKIIEKKVKANHNLSKYALLKKIKSDLYNLGYDQNLIIEEISQIDLNNEEDILTNTFKKELRKLQKKYNGKELKDKLKYNLYKKGFNLDDINNLVNEELL